jgi:peptidyl-prolyl cis-trans isomerase SurA
MNRGIYSFLFLFFSILTVYAQDDETILTIGETKISKAEFERIYKKNNNNLLNESEKKTPEEYLGLFINFKLKVLEAQSLKMDTAAAFINELAGYRKELAAPYLTDIQFEDKMVHDLYDRMKKEVNASHILFMLDKNAPESQVQTVLSKITGLREQIVAGKDFNEAAREYSEDPSAKTNGGNLGYFSAFQMVAPFEDAAFSTPEGQVSAPVRSSFGYHLIKVNGVRENRGEIKVAHIMKMFPQGGATAAAKKQLKSEIDSVYSQLKNGADFAEMAKKYSDDKRSAVQGGEMPWFSAARMIPEFSEPAFALKNIGDYSTPIETSFGYHIIKKMDSRAVAPF